MRDVIVAGERGLVAVGGCRTDAAGVGLAWSSADGADWTRLTETDFDIQLRSAVSDPTGETLVFVGDGEDELRAMALLLNGGSAPSVATLPTDLDTTSVYSVDAHPELGYLAVGVGYEGSPEGPALAQAWLLAPPYDGEWLAVEPPADARAFSDVLALDGGMLVAGVTGEFTAGTWQWDSRSWSVAQPIAQAEADDPGEIEQVTPGLLLADQALWAATADGWELQHRFEVQGSISSVAPMHEGLIAVGRSEEGDQPMIVLTSVDGIDWRQASQLPDYQGDLVRKLVAYAPDIVVGVGIGTVWQGPGQATDW